METEILKKNNCGKHYSKTGGKCSKCERLDKPYTRANAHALAMINNGKPLN